VKIYRIDFGLSEIQAKAILEMRLQRLTGLERDKINAEYKELFVTIERLKGILASKELQMQIIAEELTELQKKYKDERRTEIVYNSQDFTIEDMIANEEVIVSISHKGFIKRTPVSNYRRQNKGGRGASGAATYDDDFIEHVFQASTHHFLMFFTDGGQVYRVKVYDLPEGSKNAKGRSLANIIQMNGEEKVTAYLTVKEFTDDQFIVMSTKEGVIKKTSLSAFESVRVTGKIGILLHDNDKLISARLTDGSNDIILGTRNGIACRFRETDVRPMGRATAGVRGITLEGDDYVISMIIIRRPDAQVLVVGERGYGKRTKYEDFRLTRRGAKGVISMNVTEKTGKVVGIISPLDAEDLIVMTHNGILIRQPVKDIRTIGRNTQGVKLIRLEEGDQIADITTVTRDEDDESETGNIVDNSIPVDLSQEELFNKKD
jgi:DNA gyrase subunit A